MKSPSPLLGYNNNVPHKGRMYHVQTEDSGTQRPHIITHLFADGGRVVTSRKTSYADYVGTPDLSDRVREMMREQHKAMVIALRDGDYDALIDGEQVPSPALAEPDRADGLEATLDDEELQSPVAVPRQLPVDLLEQLAAEAERELYAEFRALASTSGPATTSSPGAYRFIGDSQRPPRSSRSAPSNPQGWGAERARTPPSGSAASRPAATIADDPFEDADEEDYADRVSQEIERARLDTHAAARAAWSFGHTLLSDRRLDEVIVELLAE